MYHPEKQWIFNTTAEKSFSKLKLIKSYLRTSMSQDHLSNLSLISIEHETAEKIDFDPVLVTLLLQKFERLKYDNVCSANSLSCCFSRTNQRN